MYFLSEACLIKEIEEYTESDWTGFVVGLSLLSSLFPAATRIDM